MWAMSESSRACNSHERPILCSLCYISASSALDERRPPNHRPIWEGDHIKGILEGQMFIRDRAWPS